MFDPEITIDIQSCVMELSSVPLGNLIGSIRPGYRYGYIGMKDRMIAVEDGNIILQPHPALPVTYAGSTLERC